MTAGNEVPVLHKPYPAEKLEAVLGGMLGS